MTVLSTGDQKRKTYWKIFYVLAALTAFELAIVSTSLPRIVVTMLVVVASLSKAFAVGWFYMHLNHESKGLRTVLLFPIFVAFFYAIFLITDAKLDWRRHANTYVGEPKRFFGPRNLKLRKVDDFGNTVVDDIPASPANAEEAPGKETKPAGDNASAASASSVVTAAAASPAAPAGEQSDKKANEAPKK